MAAIYKRELKSYLHSVIGWLFMAVTLFFAGIYVTGYNLTFGEPSLAFAVSSILFLYLLTAPVLTMRLLAEERRQKTDQLILTAPVSVGKIVMGKYLAAATILAVPTTVLCLYPLLLSQFGEVPMLESYTAILAYFLFGLACLAIGMFVSSVTESQVIAAVLGIALLFVGYMMGSLCSFISQTGNVLTAILSSFDLGGRLNGFMSGTLDLTAVVYFITIIGLFLFLTCQSIQKRRWTISTKSVKLGAFSSSLIVIVAAIAVVVNLAVNELPASVTQIDATDSRMYTLTDTTKELASALTEDVTIYVLNREDSADSVLTQTLERFAELSEHIRVEYRDPYVNPNFYTNYTETAPSINSLIVAGGQRSRVVDYRNIYQTETDYATYSSTTTGYDGEGQITSAIAYVTGDELPVVYVVQGHDELTLDAGFTDALQKENITTQNINLLQHEQVPEDADGLFILAPLHDFSAEDAKKVTDYLDRGGKALIVTAWNENEMPNFDSILAHYGVSRVKGMVVDTDQEHYYQSPLYLLPDIQYSQITGNLSEGGRLLFMPYAQGYALGEEAPRDTVEIETALSSSEDSYSKTDVINMETAEKEDGDIDGPFPLALYITETVENGEMKAAFFSSQDLFTDSANSMVAGANLELFSNTVSTLVEHESSVSVPVKSYNNARLVVSQQMVVLLSLAVTILLPLTLLAAGIAIWMRRRKL